MQPLVRLGLAAAVTALGRGRGVRAGTGLGKFGAASAKALGGARSQKVISKRSRPRLLPELVIEFDSAVEGAKIAKSTHVEKHVKLWK